ncbi:discoidin domain-containing protein [Longispora sp. NPDC051575]|uniref:discoidin domain-containing protein n=1 Tax=Longispora sp. NPDC051575 TaxID=3154943 RepID=UPI00342D8E11
MRTRTFARAAVAALAVVGSLTLAAPPAIAADNPAPAVVPALQEWTAGAGSLQLSASSRVVVPAGASPRLTQLATQLVAEITELTPLRLTTATGSPAQGDIALRVDPNASYGAVLANLKPEAYRLATTAASVTITGASDTGLYYGTRSLLQILVKGSTVPLGTAVDYPNYAVRGFMLDVGRRYFTPEFIQSYIKWMGWLKLNTFQLHLNDNEIHPANGDWSKAYSAFRLKSTNPDFAGLAATDGSYTRANWDSFEATAAAHAITLVPEIDAPGHARAFVKAHPELGLNGGNSDNLDLSKAATTTYMKSVYSEFAPWFKGSALHMGADEYPGDKALLKVYINTMAGHIRSLGKQVRIWGGFSVFPGGATGYDRDMTVNSWNNGYYSGPAAIADGYDVINSNDGQLYVVPFADYYHGNGLDASSLYSSWEPHVFGDQTVPVQHARLKGAMPAVWNDLVHATYTELDVHGLVKKSFAVLAQKQWSAKKSGTDYGAFTSLVAAVGMGPGVAYLKPVVNPNDLALNRPTTASSQETAGLAPVFATDGEQATRWASTYSDNQWIQVDLGATKSVGGVVLDWEGAYGKDYDIQVSADGTTWTTVSQRRGRTTAGVDAVTLTPVNARHVRMQGLARGTTYGYSLFRFEVLAAAASTDLARGGTATASSTETANFTAPRANDGDPATRWSSAYTNGEWLQVDLGSAKTVGRAVLTWEAAYGKDYDLQVSANGTTWTTVATRRGENGGVDDVTFTPTSARFVRMQGVTRGTTYGYSLYTFELRSS